MRFIYTTGTSQYMGEYPDENEQKKKTHSNNKEGDSGFPEHWYCNNTVNRSWGKQQKHIQLKCLLMLETVHSDDKISSLFPARSQINYCTKFHYQITMTKPIWLLDINKRTKIDSLQIKIHTQTAITNREE